jgi:hypothetical protein
MRAWFRYSALLLTLATLASAAAIELRAAQTVTSNQTATSKTAAPKSVASPRAAPGVTDGTSGDITGSIGPRAHYLPLTDEQRGHIFDDVMKLRNAPVAEMSAPAAAVPSSVALQDLPASATRDVPMVEGYKFVKLDDRILLVSPLDRAVVADMPRYKQMLD